MEIAIKMAFQHFQLRGDEARREFVSLTGGYHGDTIGSVSVGGIDLFHRIFKPLLFDVHHAPQPYCYRCPLGKALPACAMACADDVEAIFAARPGKIAALVIEPLMQGADGMIAQPPGYLRRMREICDRHGALLVCDEVATGWGRTGTTFAVEQEGVVPDLMTMAKGLTGGYLPLAATLTTEEVFESFLGAVRVEADLLPRPHLRRQPAGLRGGHRLDEAVPRPADHRGAAGPDRARWRRALAPLAGPPPRRRDPAARPDGRASSWCAIAPPGPSTSTRCGSATRSAWRRGPTACSCGRWATWWC